MAEWKARRGSGFHGHESSEEFGVGCDQSGSRDSGAAKIPPSFALFYYFVSEKKRKKKKQGSKSRLVKQMKI
jgi:hypothetical protein